jgi:hypothetical protein
MVKNAASDPATPGMNGMPEGTGSPSFARRAMRKTEKFITAPPAKKSHAMESKVRPTSEPPVMGKV